MSSILGPLHRGLWGCSTVSRCLQCPPAASDVVLDVCLVSGLLQQSADVSNVLQRPLMLSSMSFTVCAFLSNLGKRKKAFGIFSPKVVNGKLFYFHVSFSLSPDDKLGQRDLTTSRINPTMQWKLQREKLKKDRCLSKRSYNTILIRNSDRKSFSAK